jgi:hypothetical protein
MCLKPKVIEETDKVLAFVAAIRILVLANAELGAEAYSGTLILLGEVEQGLNAILQDLKACAAKT